jgi:hypothetical protein
MEYLREQQPWPGIRQEIWKTLIGCQECKKYNILTTRVGPKIDPFIIYASKKLLCMDAWGPVGYTENGNRYCIVDIDHFTKIAVALAVKEVNGQAMCNFVETILTVTGPYKKLLVDAERYVAGNVFGDYLTRRGIGRHVVKAVHPEANGCCERFIRAVQQSFLKISARENNWDLFVDPAKRGYNYSWHSTIRMAPFKCHEFARNRGHQVHKDAINLTMKQRENMVKRDDKKDFQIGDMVYIIPRPKGNMKRAAHRHFKEIKWGPAKINENFPENKINVEFEGKEIIAYG